MTQPFSRRDLLGAALGAPLLAGPARATAATPRYTLLTLLHTNDLHGRVHLPGEARGLARLATLVRQIRAQMPHVLLLDAGDIIHGTPEEKAFGGQPILSAMNALNYDAATVGNHEFDFGQDNLRVALRMARFPFLSANVVDEKTGRPWDKLLPFVVCEVNGVRVAVFGLTTPTTVAIQWPRTLGGIRFNESLDEARVLVSRLRNEQRADLVIGLTHLGFEADKALAAVVPGIDVILGGHSHTTLNEQVWASNTLIAQTGAHGANLGRVDLVVRTTGDALGRVVLVNGKNGRWWGHNGVRAPLANVVFPAAPLLPALAAPDDDMAVRNAYRPFADRLSGHLNELLTTLADNAPLPVVGALTARAVRAAYLEADIGVAAASQIDARGLERGPVRTRDLYTLMGAYTRQHLVLARAPGALVRGLLAGADTTPPRLFVSPAQSPPQIVDTQIYAVAGAAHILQDSLLNKPGVSIVADDVRAPTVREALIAFLRQHRGKELNASLILF